MIDIPLHAYHLLNLLLAAAIALAFTRLLRGPSLADRVNAADVIALCVIGILVASGWKRQDPAMLDVALVSGLVLFAGTSAVALFIGGDDLRKSDDP